MRSGFSEVSAYAVCVELWLGASVIAIERFVWWKPVLDRLPSVYALDGYLPHFSLSIIAMIYSLYVIFAAT